MQHEHRVDTALTKSSFQNPWQDYFTSMELRRTIAQDVERTCVLFLISLCLYLTPSFSFPEIPFFRLAPVQRALTTILFLHCLTHPEIGYRQGMHELLAPIYYAISRDSNPSIPLCHPDYVAADSYYLFGIIMGGSMKGWYEWRDNAISGAPEIVKACNEVQNEWLRKVDPMLWGKLNETGIEPQIYGM